MLPSFLVERDHVTLNQRLLMLLICFYDVDSHLPLKAILFGKFEQHWITAASSR